ncbi:hypothetical protein AGRO_4323 [Agrobacterium sp. ATCC 31749]|uniref:hypothetical protein n=1 Tax=unclassified Agrobacterium TaxID=2632611 RepID=UPI00020DB77B|nr:MULTISPECIES: hypothetical protein [unclassified Agrobacterium]EGL62849.1 hypothetical protein AGRO_4323 [Agrobacterium sp. ATCC 31749]QKW99754.1 hypothetical protein GSF67_21910 [Agrobacterium sp. CGMCC 11546]
MTIAVDPIKMSAPEIIDRTKMKPAILPVFFIVETAPSHVCGFARQPRFREKHCA